MEKPANHLAQPYKVLIVAFGFYPETHGVAEVAYRHALGLHQWGHQVTVITRGKKGENFPFEVVCVEQKVDYQVILKLSEASVIFVHGWNNWASDWVIELLPLPAKVVLVSHGTNFNVRLGGIRGLVWWLRQRRQAWHFDKKMRSFDHYVFLSDVPEPQRMSDVVWVKKNKFSSYSVIPNGARPAFGTPSTRDFRLENGLPMARMLLCVSNYTPTKGHQELVKWFREMQLPDAVLVLIGSNFNDFSSRLKRLAGEELNKTIFLFDQQTEAQIQAAYGAADVFVTATHTEVQPLMLLDAMAVGLPFLSRSVGVISSLAGGMCFQDKTTFQPQLRLLLADDVLRKRLGKEGTEATKNTHHWDIIALKYHQLVCSLLDNQV